MIDRFQLNFCTTDSLIKTHINKKIKLLNVITKNDRYIKSIVHSI